MSYSLLFDIGNVIVNFDFQLAVKRIAPECSVDSGAILENVATLMVDLEIGRISTEDFLDQAIEKVGYTGERSFLIESIQNIFELNGEMVDLIETESKKGTTLYLLSNTNGIHVPFLFETYSVFHLFDDAIYSHEVRCMKPDPKIFQKTISQLKIDPHKTIYIDDLPANCEEGKAHGLQAICYQKSDHQRFIEQFEAAKTDLSG